MGTDEKKDDYRRKYKDAQEEKERLLKELDRLRKENEDLKKKKMELEKKKHELEKKNKDLEKKLALLEKEKALQAPSPFFKPNTKGKRKKAGAPKGHKGTSRKRPNPEDITDELVLTTDTCPHCGGHVEEPENGDERFVIDIPLPRPRIMRVVTKRPYCHRCGIRITPLSPDFFPGKKYGNNLAIAVSTWRMNGVTREKIRFMLKEFYGITFSTKTIQDMEEFVATQLRDVYEAIKDGIRKADDVGADETGWRKDGVNHWAWVFSTDDAALFVVNRSRGSKVPKKILGKKFDGVVVNDGWNGYSPLKYRKQQCLIHINRQLQRAEVRYGIEPRGFLKDEKPIYKRRGRPHEEFVKFSGALRTILREAVEFIGKRRSKNLRIKAERNFRRRLSRLINKEYKDELVLKMVKFLRRYIHEIFTFVEVPRVPWHNNRAERDIRPAVVIRKNSYGSKSSVGARTFETMMTLFMTCKKRGLNFVDWMKEKLSLRALGIFAARS